MALPAQLAAIQDMAVTQKYQSGEGMTVFLANTGTHGRQRNRITADGFDTLDTLVHHYENDVEGFEAYLTNLNKTFATATVAAQRVYYSPPNIKSLVGGLYYFMESIKCFHRVPDMSRFTTVIAQDCYNLYKERKDKADGEDDIATTESIKLKGHDNYVKWRDAFMHKLSQTIGRRHIPLDYVLDATPRQVTRSNQNLIEVESIDLSEENLYKTTTTHFGELYKADNKRVWDLIKADLLGSPPYNHIAHLENTRNGNAAWRALREFYEGIDFQETLRAEAFKDIKNAFYSGETSRYNFEKYVQIHQQAHTKLLEAGYNGGRGMDEETKVQHFEEGIRANADLEVALASVRANRATYRNFTRLATYLKSEVDVKQRRKAVLKMGNSNRRVASTTSKSGNGSNKSNNKKGNNRAVPSEVVEGKTVYGKHYPLNQFRNMSRAQKDTIARLRREAKANSGNNNKSIAAIEAKLEAVTDTMSTMEDRIIAGVTRASMDDEELTDDGTVKTTGTKRSAKSGSVGNFIAGQKKPRKSPN